MYYNIFKRISRLAAAALSTGIVVSASTVSDTAEVVAAEESISKLEAFEMALLEGKSPCVSHALELTDEILQNSRICPAYFNAANKINSENATYPLEKIHGRDEENSYTLWSGRIVVPNVSKFVNEFNEPASFLCGVNGINKTAYMTAKSGFEGNYKVVSLYGTFRDNNGNTYKRTYHNDGADKTVGVPLIFTGSGELIEMAAYCYMYNGTGQNAGYYEIALVHVVAEDYADSAEYAAEPYAGLIGCYTYVDTDSLGVLPPVIGSSEK